jgi:hypothetical protein
MFYWGFWIGPVAACILGVLLLTFPPKGSQMPASAQIQQVQQNLEDAFANFRQANPEIAEAMRVLNISYAEYLNVLFGLNLAPETASGNTQTPT